MSDSDTRRRFSLWWWLAAVVVLLVVATVTVRFYSTSEYFAPELVISRETTYITEPLTPEGLPDYAAYLNSRLSRGVTPENNAAVLLLQALGPRPDGERIPPEVFSRLGLSWPGEGAPSYVSIRRQLQLRFRQDEFALERAEELSEELSQRPWRAGESPQAALVARLLEQQRRLDLVVQASRRPRFFVPVVSRGEPLLELDFSVIVALRGPIRDLPLRAMWHLGHGRPRQAWADLLALKRLALLVQQRWSVVDMLIGIAGEGLAFLGVVQLLEHSPPDESTAWAWLEQWRQHPSAAELSRVLNEGDRLVALDSLLQLRSSKLKSVNGRKVPISPAALDWNVIMRMFNHRYDQLVELSRADNYYVLQEKIRLWRQRSREMEDIPLLVLFVFLNRRIRSERVGYIILETFVTDLHAAKVAELRAHQEHQLIETALALAVYRARHGHYPEKLDALVPELLPQVPPDLFAPGTTLIYRREGDGYVLYSVGQNGEDDGGEDKVLEERQDLGFRISGTSSLLPLVAPPVEDQP